MSEPTAPLQTSYLPTRTGNPPASAFVSALAAIWIVLLPTVASSTSPANLSGTRSLISQDRRHSTVRNEEPLSFFIIANLLIDGRAPFSGDYIVAARIRVSIPQR